jgi:hypothetical protein
LELKSVTSLKEAHELVRCDDAPILKALASWADGTPVPPFNEIIERYGTPFLGSRGWFLQHYGDAARKDFTEHYNDIMQLLMVREVAIAKYGFVLPSAELLDALAQYQPMVEIGAGTGYMTRLMRHRGIDVVGTDINDEAYSFACGAWDPLQEKLTAIEAVRYYSERTVFCAWPSLHEDWFHKALKAMSKGQRLIAVEEDACATEAAWTYLQRKFDYIRNVDIPAWPSVHDSCAAWKKR